jgi:hypothetical protein
MMMSEEQVQVSSSPVDLQNKIALIIGMALKALSNRVMALIGMFLVFCMFGWVVYDPSVLKIIAATIFSISAWSILKLEIKEHKNG